MHRYVFFFATCMKFEERKDWTNDICIIQHKYTIHIHFDSTQPQHLLVKNIIFIQLFKNKDTWKNIPIYIFVNSFALCVPNFKTKTIIVLSINEMHIIYYFIIILSFYIITVKVRSNTRS